MTEIVSRFPPNYDAIVAALGRPPLKAVFAYDGVIYAPNSAKEVTPDLVVHESVHFEQQERVGGSEKWWTFYLSDAAFRLEQEAEAYRAQLACFPSRPARRDALRRFSKSLAGPMYRLPISAAQAKEIILAGRLSPMAVPA